MIESWSGLVEHHDTRLVWEFARKCGTQSRQSRECNRESRDKTESIESIPVLFLAQWLLAIICAVLHIRKPLVHILGERGLVGSRSHNTDNNASQLHPRIESLPALSPTVGDNQNTTVDVGFQHRASGTLFHKEMIEFIK
jgi:hypothetical protein